MSTISDSFSTLGIGGGTADRKILIAVDFVRAFKSLMVYLTSRAYGTRTP